MGLLARVLQTLVMPGLDPGIHHFVKKMDCRIKSGNDERPKWPLLSSW
jgi:hypothetical protein